MKLAALIPTFERDGALLPEVIRALRRTYPGIAIAILEDENKPLLPEHLEAVLALGITRYTSDCNRRGNLNGLPVTRDLLEALKLFAAETGADWIIKNDSDTLLFGDPFGARENENIRAIFPTNQNITWGLGAAYMLRVDCIRDLITRFAARPENARTRGEDYEISTACREFYGTAGVPYLDGFLPEIHYVFRSNKYAGTERPIEDAGKYTVYPITHWGARSTLPKTLTGDQPRAEYIRQRMKFANDFFEKGNANA